MIEKHLKDLFLTQKIKNELTTKAIKDVGFISLCFNKKNWEKSFFVYKFQKIIFIGMWFNTDDEEPHLVSKRLVLTY